MKCPIQIIRPFEINKHLYCTNKEEYILKINLKNNLKFIENETSNNALMTLNEIFLDDKTN